MRHEFESSSLAAIKTPISQEALDQLFREARTHSTWLPEPVPVELLRKAYEFGAPWTDQCQRLTRQIRFSNYSRCQGASQASSSARQCRQNHGRSCDRHHRLGHGFSRESSQALSAG